MRYEFLWLQYYSQSFYNRFQDFLAIQWIRTSANFQFLNIKFLAKNNQTKMNRNSWFIDCYLNNFGNELFILKIVMKMIALYSIKMILKSMQNKFFFVNVFPYRLLSPCISSNPAASASRRTIVSASASSEQTWPMAKTIATSKKIIPNRMFILIFIRCFCCGSQTSSVSFPIFLAFLY